MNQAFVLSVSFMSSKKQLGQKNSVFFQKLFQRVMIYRLALSCFILILCFLNRVIIDCLCISHCIRKTAAQFFLQPARFHLTHIRVLRHYGFLPVFFNHNRLAYLSTQAMKQQVGMCSCHSFVIV